MVSPVEKALEPIQKLLDNQKFIELVCNAAGELWAETRTGKWEHFSVPELTEDYWNNLARGLAVLTGQRFSERKPIMRGTLPGGHRLFLMTGTDVLDRITGGPGICAAIRLKRQFAADIESFGVDMNGEKILRDGVRAKRNILVAGGMGSGKTTLTKILCSWIEDHRPVSIEDSAELELEQPVATQFLISAIESDTEVTNRDVVSNIQRSRGDRFILGEITMENAFILMRLLNLGSPGTIGTIHCDFATDAIESVAELMVLSGYAKDYDATIRYLTRKIDLVAFVERAGPARVISEIFAPDDKSVTGGDWLWRRG